MHTKLSAIFLASTLALAFSNAAMAGPREDVLAQYAVAAKAENPTFGGFSAQRGKALHNQQFTTGKPETPSCTSCHGTNPLSAGKNATGKVIDAVAVSVTPTRYTDPAKVEKWFKRNCNDVLGRACSATEKGDWLSYVMSQ
jgi:alpha-L-fucosidase